MKNKFIFILCLTIQGLDAVYADNYCDTVQCINTIMQIIDNAIPVEIPAAEWTGEWHLDEWQQIQYMPQEDIYQTSHITDCVASVEIASDNLGTIEINGYHIVCGNCTNSVISIPNQQVNNPIGTQDGIYGSKVVLYNGELYIHLRIVGTQDFAVDIYGVGTKQERDDEHGGTGNNPIGIHRTPSASKLLHNNQILILRGDHTYTLTGQEVK